MARAPVVPGRPLTQGALIDADGATAAAVRAFASAEAELRRELERIVEIVALDPTSTKVYRDAQIRNLNARLAIMRAELHGQSVLFAEDTLARIYVDGMDRANRAAGLGPIMRGQPSFTLVHRQALEILAVDAYNDLAAATSFMDAQAKRTIREATKARTMLSAAAGSTLAQDRTALVGELARNGVTGFVDAAGRNWRLSSYAEMVIRTKGAHAYNTGTILRTEETGTRALMIVDGERSRHDECLAYNRLTASPGWALDHPIQHPNCVRGFAPLPLHQGPVDLGGDDPAARDAIAEEHRRRSEAGAFGDDNVLAAPRPPEAPASLAGNGAPAVLPAEVAGRVRTWDDARSWAEGRGIALDRALEGARGLDEIQAAIAAYETIERRYPQVSGALSGIRYKLGGLGEAAAIEWTGLPDLDGKVRGKVYLNFTGRSTLRPLTGGVNEGIGAGVDAAYLLQLHEMGHLVQTQTPWLTAVKGKGAGMAPEGRSPVSLSLREAGYAKGRGIDRELLSSDVSRYGLTNDLETHAEIFALYNRPGGISSLPTAAQGRLEAFREDLNRRISGYDPTAGPAL